MFQSIAQRFSSVLSSFGRSGKISKADIDTTLESIKQALLDSDVPFSLVESFSQEVAQEVAGQTLSASLKPAEQLSKIVFDKVKKYLSDGQQTVPFSFQLPSVIMVMGLQGSGKTTTIAKLAHFVQKEAATKNKSRRILLASVDFYRPAAVDQLEILAGQCGVPFYRSPEKDPVAAAQDIYRHFKQGLFELLFLDTAGRMHIDNGLLQELQHIDVALEPKYKVLVLDSMTGQESLAVAQAFSQVVGFDFGIMTKMDSEARAGAIFSFRYMLKKPIMFTGTGEKLEDLEQFFPDRAASRMLGMGDIVTLAEKANQKIKQSEQEQAYKAFTQGKFTLHDFAQQIEMMNKIGSFGQLASYLPAMGGKHFSQSDIEKGEQELKKCRAIIGSMTPKERLNHKILDANRKIRIAKGSGVTVSDVNLLLQRFEESQQYAKLFKKMGKFSQFFK